VWSLVLAIADFFEFRFEISWNWSSK